MGNQSTPRTEEMNPGDTFLSPRQLTHLVGYNLGAAAVFSGALVMFLDHDPVPSQLLTRTLLTVMAAGGVGATLCNFRGFFRHMQDKCGFFPRRLQTPFYLRPAMGMLSGLAVFFLAHLLATSVGTDAAVGGWETVRGRFSFVALALLGGFASQELMQRLKEVAKATFSVQGSQGSEDEERKAARHLKGAKQDTAQPGTNPDPDNRND